jgi:hypothetical protein
MTYESIKLAAVIPHDFSLHRPFKRGGKTKYLNTGQIKEFNLLL